jgi:hypothetical protein
MGLLLVLLAVPLAAQDKPTGAPGTQAAAEGTPAAAENADALRKAAQNPVASLISVPIQNNNNFNISPGDRTQDVLNIQPVIPVRLTDSWNLIARIITPIVYQLLPPVDTRPTSQGAYGFRTSIPLSSSPHRSPAKSFGAWVPRLSSPRPQISSSVRESGAWGPAWWFSPSRENGRLESWSTTCGPSPGNLAAKT